MVRVHIWLRRREDLSEEEFRAYWENNHAPIARDGYRFLTGYVINAVTRVPEGQERPYDGVAELTWDDREGFSADMKSEAAAAAAKDLENFTSGSGLLFVDQTAVK